MMNAAAGRYKSEDMAKKQFGQGKLPKIPKSNGQSAPRLTEEEKILQGQAMLVRRVSENLNYTEIARIFGVTRAAVAERLAMARATEFTQLAQEIISERMLPKALAVLDNELEAGNYEAAKDLLFGSQVYQKGGKTQIEHVTSNSPTLEQIRKERAKAVEGQIIESEPERGEPTEGSNENHGAEAPRKQLSATGEC